MSSHTLQPNHWHYCHPTLQMPSTHVCVPEGQVQSPVQAFPASQTGLQMLLASHTPEQAQLPLQGLPLAHAVCNVNTTWLDVSLSLGITNCSLVQQCICWMQAKRTPQTLYSVATPTSPPPARPLTMHLPWLHTGVAEGHMQLESQLSVQSGVQMLLALHLWVPAWQMQVVEQALPEAHATCGRTAGRSGCSLSGWLPIARCWQPRLPPLRNVADCIVQTASRPVACWLPWPPLLRHCPWPSSSSAICMANIALVRCCFLRCNQPTLWHDPHPPALLPDYMPTHPQHIVSLQERHPCPCRTLHLPPLQVCPAGQLHAGPQVPSEGQFFLHTPAPVPMQVLVAVGHSQMAQDWLLTQLPCSSGRGRGEGSGGWARQRGLGRAGDCLQRPAGVLLPFSELQCAFAPIAAAIHQLFDMPPQPLTTHLPASGGVGVPGLAGRDTRRACKQTSCGREIRACQPLASP